MDNEHDASDITVEESSGNVFADLGLPCNEAEMMKVSIAREITNILAKRRLTQTRAAKIVGIDQARISDITRGNLRGISAEKLFDTLSALGHDVEIQISSCRIGRGTLKVRSA
jgi:predicted XRE-type DNA-binding protein